MEIAIICLAVAVVCLSAIVMMARKDWHNAMFKARMWEERCKDKDATISIMDEGMKSLAVRNEDLLKKLIVKTISQESKA
ncbi:MAG: hypothetical protein LBQ76_08585 [Candidatus Fibromonas sp.]|jgi:hypothetical protein|nr:hypothetical protein [Candidatus Fibromonas sp.]